MVEEIVDELYCDGGVIAKNPSPTGGVCAWCRVESGAVAVDRVFVLRPDEIGSPTVSNNNTELLALIDGIESLPHDWRGRVNSDSRIALGWVFSGFDQRSIPEPLRGRLNALRGSGRLNGLRWRLVQGHPTRKDLERGIGAKRGLPVSRHNSHVDRLCKQAAKATLEAGGERG